MWLGGVPVPHLVPWLAGFIVLTIAGERLELARIAMGPGAGTKLLPLAAAVMAGVVASLLWPTAGHPLLGLTLLALVAWLACHDVARMTIRSTGLPRFMAANMLAGYAWLAVAAGTWALTGASYDGAAYDAVVHAVFLGFERGIAALDPDQPGFEAVAALLRELDEHIERENLGIFPVSVVTLGTSGWDQVERARQVHSTFLK